MIMRRVCNILCVCMFLIGVCAPARAALPGTTCSTAIPLGDDYSAQITGPKSVWYSAWTFDLPLTVKFVPSNPNDPAPDVEMDFTCTKDVYTDSILCSLFCPNSGSGIEFDMPHHPVLSSKTEDGVFFYYLAMGKSYRDLLLKTGIDYNVEVYVKVTYKAGGTISLAADTFANCMDGHKFMHLGDAVQVKPLNKDSHVIVPYVQWQEDSIRYVWSGTAPVEVGVGNACEFDPTDISDTRRLDYFVMQSPRDTFKMTSADVKYYIQSGKVSSEAGMFYAKFYTSGTGTMKIERVPQAPPQGGATLLRYDRITPIPADTNALFAMPYTWDTATIFTTPTDHVFKMYIGTTHDFQLPDASATYQFHAGNNGHWLGLTNEQMRELWTNTSDKYLYVRFECSAKTTIKPAVWDMPQCFTGNTAAEEILRPQTKLQVVNTYGVPTYYRFYYKEWKGGAMTFAWSNSSASCPTFIGDNCEFPARSNNTHVHASQSVDNNSSWTIPEEEVADWEEYVDENGYLYVRFNNGDKSGTMTVSTNAPDEMDPETLPYSKTTINVVCDPANEQRLIVLVSKNQTLSVYSGEPDNIASRTPVETWSQTRDETHNLVLSSGVYTLKGEDETIRVVVQ